jgi:hypothetical protein
MGSDINLRLKHFEVDWGRNSTFIDHTALFQPDDIKLMPYTHVDGYGKRTHPRKRALSKPMHLVLPRLELLGHTLETASVRYEALFETGHFSQEVSFDEFAAACSRVDCGKVKRTYENDFAFGEFAAKEVVPRLFGKKFNNALGLRRTIGELFENLHPWDTLRLMAENSNNLKYELTWYFSDVIDEGHADEQLFIPTLPTAQRFLVVTEGSSDSKILERALQIRRPEIKDFFYFIDMQSDYPFTGIGNLHKFTQGLAKIKLLNGCIVIYDNDGEGTAKFSETSRVRDLPPNLRVLKLPDMQEFESFPTIGPNGSFKANINGRAAAIECYLDLRSVIQPSSVRWTTYLDKALLYHGRLEAKERLTKDFFRRCREPQYDYSKIDQIISLLVRECISIAETRSDVI